MTRFGVLILCISLCQLAFGQRSNQDTTFYRHALQNALSLYEQSLNGQSLIFNGSEYVEPTASTDDSHAFFLSDDWINGSVTYDGQRFDNIPLLYDLVQDKLVTELRNAIPVTLISEKVSVFKVQSHTFVRISREEAKKGLSHAGFYEQLYEGETKVLARIEKGTYERIESAVSIQRGYEEKIHYYILHNGSYTPVKYRASVLHIFPDKKSELRKYINTNRLDFQNDRENAFRRIAAYYDSLNQL